MKKHRFLLFILSVLETYPESIGELVNQYASCKQSQKRREIERYIATCLLPTLTKRCNVFDLCAFLQCNSLAIRTTVLQSLTSILLINVQWDDDTLTAVKVLPRIVDYFPKTLNESRATSSHLTNDLLLTTTLILSKLLLEIFHNGDGIDGVKTKLDQLRLSLEGCQGGVSKSLVEFVKCFIIWLDTREYTLISGVDCTTELSEEEQEKILKTLPFLSDKAHIRIGLIWWISHVVSFLLLLCVDFRIKKNI